MEEIIQLVNKRIIKGLVSIVIPHAGPLDLLKKCIRDIQQYTTVDYEIIIAADKCDDETLEYLKLLYKDGVRLILNPELMSATVAENMGYMAAQGEYLCKFNTDVGLTPGWLKAMKETLSAHPDYGWVALTTKQEWGPGFFPGASLFTYEALEKLGLMLDEIFAGGYGFDDDDYLRRMLQAGYDPHIIPQPKVDHPYSGTTFVAVYGEEQRMPRFQRNQKLFAKKWGQTGTPWEKLPVAEPINMPEVSIIIPTLNTPELAECIKCIREHTPPIYELIIVADAPTPEFKEVLHQAETDGARIMINDKKTTPEISWNQGVRKSLGEYIVFMNSDTFVIPGWLEPLLDAIKKHSEFGWVAAGIEGLDMANFVCGLVPRKVFDEVGPFDESFQFINDQDYYYRMLDAGYKPHGVAKSKVIHHPGSTTFKAIYGDRLQEAFMENYHKLVEKWGQRATPMLDWGTVPIYHSDEVKEESTEQVKLNIGSFTVMLPPPWLNLDILDLATYAKEKGFNFQQADVTQGLPFDDNSIDFINSSHLIEHLTVDEGVAFLKECWRVLKPNSIVRIGTPDVNKLVGAYKAGEMGKFNNSQPDEYKQSPSQADKFWRIFTAGHKICYDLPALRGSFKLAGFTEVYEPAYNEELDMFPELSLYSEAKKGALSEIKQFMKEKSERKITTSRPVEGIPEYWRDFATENRMG